MIPVFFPIFGVITIIASAFFPDDAFHVPRWVATAVGGIFLLFSPLVGLAKQGEAYPKSAAVSMLTDLVLVSLIGLFAIVAVASSLSHDSTLGDRVVLWITAVPLAGMFVLMFVGMVHRWFNWFRHGEYALSISKAESNSE